MGADLPVVDIAAETSTSFTDRLAAYGLELRSAPIQTLQVNVGKLCNQACKHCHVDAGPNRNEIMTRETAERVIRAVEKLRVPIVDITGGAPELNPTFRHLVESAREAGASVIVRHNLTVMFEPDQDDLPEFFRDNNVEIISSLPYFRAEETDAQRGRGVFGRSIEALRRLNRVGYGTGGDLLLHLVYNPVGAFLPAEQQALERDFKKEMRARYDVSFDRLYTIVNMPIKRFLSYLRRTGNEQRYMDRLLNAFNPSTVDGLMCRSTVSVDWEGRLYDCDFNQMLALPVLGQRSMTIDDLDSERLIGRQIVTGAHCFGCTAGSGSSCGGALTA
jgi:radical SAM/Cys-rich protein